MSTHIHKTKYKNVNAVCIEDENLKVTFLPEHGGKMASLICKKTEKELLVQAPGENYKTLKYDGRYIDSECSGFDDMFPTIDECDCDHFPWYGIKLPDHGEVCALEWDCEVEEGGECLHCWVYGVRFPYRLDKWIRLSNNSSMRIDYKAENLSKYDMDFIWAAHIMINAESGARILVPYKDGAEATCVFSEDEKFSKPGKKINWPVTNTTDNKTIDISKTGPQALDGNTYKFYFNEPLPESWCGYAYSNENTVLLIKYSKETVPYLGIWVNNGAFKDYFNIALEPCTGTFDNPKSAIEHGQNSVLPGHGEYRWNVQFCILNKNS